MVLEIAVVVVVEVVLELVVVLVLEGLTVVAVLPFRDDLSGFRASVVDVTSGLSGAVIEVGKLTAEPPLTAPEIEVPVCNGRTEICCDTEVAAYVSVPACDTLIMQIPAELKVTTPADIEHTCADEPAIDTVGAKDASLAALTV